MERIQFIEHQGKRVLLCDLTGCGPQEIIDIGDEVVMMITSQPQGSVLVLVDFTGARVDREAITRIKENAAIDAPYIKRSAWVGVEAMGDVWLQAIKNFSTRSLPSFKTRAEGLDWLVAEKGKAAAS